MHRIIDEPLPFRILTVALLLAGYFAVYRPAEQHLAEIQISTREMNDQAAFDEILLARKDVYERAAERMRTELSGVHFDADGVNMMATFLDDLEQRSRARNVTVAEITPQRDAAGSAANALTLHIHGTYTSVIAFLNDVSAMHTLVQIDTLKLTRLVGDMHAGQTPALDATIGASLVPVQTHAPENQQS